MGETRVSTAYFSLPASQEAQPSAPHPDSRCPHFKHQTHQASKNKPKSFSKPFTPFKIASRHTIHTRKCGVLPRLNSDNSPRNGIFQQKSRREMAPCGAWLVLRHRSVYRGGFSVGTLTQKHHTPSPVQDAGGSMTTCIH